jgi:hypothetical protein
MALGKETPAPIMRAGASTWITRPVLVRLSFREMITPSLSMLWMWNDRSQDQLQVGQSDRLLTHENPKGGGVEQGDHQALGQ